MVAREEIFGECVRHCGHHYGIEDQRGGSRHEPEDTDALFVSEVFGLEVGDVGGALSSELGA